MKFTVAQEEAILSELEYGFRTLEADRLWVEQLRPFFLECSESDSGELIFGSSPEELAYRYRSLAISYILRSVQKSVPTYNEQQALEAMPKDLIAHLALTMSDAVYVSLLTARNLHKSL